MAQQPMLSILPLLPEQSGAVSEMLAGDDSDYGRYFSGLADDEKSLVEILKSARHDIYWGIWKAAGDLSAVFMLRGLDAGFSAPAFGVYVRAADSSKGLARLAMQHALCHCRLASIDEIMLTVDDDNVSAMALYEEMGFVRTGETSPKGQPVYRRKVDAR
jgi:ribosomal protein S18 acetylase RimI-like enzyme